MRSSNARARLLEEWARYLQGAAYQGALTRGPVNLRVEGIIGPRAGALEIYAGMDAPKLLSALSRNDAALLRQFVPWRFMGEPCAYMSGRFVRVEAGWPSELAETLIRLCDLCKKPEQGGRWVAGKNETGATVVVGLNDKTPHYLISGQTGSGKSVALRSAILQLSRDPSNALVLVDGKFGESLAELQYLPGVVGPCAVEGPAARAALAWACVAMAERYRAGNYDGRVVVAVDEFQEMAGDDVFVDLLRKLCAQGRGAGVHVLAATQHPTVDAFGDSTTRRNLAGKLALRVADPDASRVAVGGRLPRADYLLGAGDAYAVGPGACHRLQMAYVDGRDVSQAGTGSWQFETWPDVPAESLGQDLPTTTKKCFTVEEVGISLLCAVDGKGRPKMLERMDEAGMARPGSDRAYKLHRFGKQLNRWLESQELGVFYAED